MKRSGLFLINLALASTALKAQNVGIGTNNPQAQLHTTGSVLFSGLNNNDTLSRMLMLHTTGSVFWANSSTIVNRTAWGLGGNTVSNTAYLGTNNNAILKIRTSSSDRVLVYSAAEIGSAISVPTVEILGPSLANGLDGPALKLTRLASNTGWASALDFAMNNNIGNRKTYARLNGGISSNVANAEDGFMSFEVASNGQIGNLQQEEKVRILANGNVGIGTKTPAAQLHSTGTVRFAGIAPNNSFNNILSGDANGNLYWRDAASLSGGNSWLINGNTLTADAYIGTNSNHRFKINTSAQERVIVYSGSEIGTSIAIPTVEIIGPSTASGFDGPALKVTRNGSGLGWASAIDFAMNNIAGQRITYARLNGGIQSNLTGSENGFMSFEITAAGEIGNLQQAEKMRLLANGFLGIGIANPTAQLHTTGTIRFQNLPSGTGNILVIDNNGNVSKAAGTARFATADEIILLKKEIELLKNELEKFKNKN
jgi:hypothetical protein